MHHTNTSTVPSVVSELQTSLCTVLAWYGTLLRLVRIFKHRTNVPYPFLYQKRVLYFLAKIEAYRTVLTYRTVLPFLFALFSCHKTRIVEKGEPLNFQNTFFPVLTNGFESCVMTESLRLQQVQASEMRFLRRIEVLIVTLFKKLRRSSEI